MEYNHINPTQLYSLNYKVNQRCQYVSRQHYYIYITHSKNESSSIFPVVLDLHVSQ